MYLPNSPWSWTFVAIAFVQALIILALESYVFATFQMDLQNASTETQAWTIPTFLTLYIFGFLYQLVLVYDALRLKNTIQIIGLCAYNVGLLIYGSVQMDQIHDAVVQLAPHEINKSIWGVMQGFLIAIPCILGFGTVLMSVAAWKLYDEFAWTIYKHISADLRMKKRYLGYQIYIALLKFDFFFFLGFTVQFVVIVTQQQKNYVEFGLTIAAIPVTILILIMAGYFTRKENMAGMIVVIILYFGGLAYFLFKLVRMYSRGYAQFYSAARKELTTFAVITLLLIICTIINACVCAHNFKKGLKPYITSRKLESEEEKAFSNATELGPGPAGKPTLLPSNRMTID